MVADNRPAQESTPRTYCIGVNVADARRRSLPLLIFSRRCRMCRDLTQVISKNPREHIATIANHCSLEQDYLPPVTPMKEAIFRTLLAHGNEPMTTEQISKFLSNKWAMTHFPRDTSPRAIRRLLELGNSGYYCIASSDSGYGREEKTESRETGQAKSSSSNGRKNPSGGRKGRANDQSPEEEDEKKRSETPDPITNGEGKPEETETVGIPPTTDGVDSKDDLTQPQVQDGSAETDSDDSRSDAVGIGPEYDASANPGALNPFESVFFDALTLIPSNAPDRPDVLPEGGPMTSESAEKDTQKGSEEGRSGAHIRKEVTRWLPTKASKDLADKFRAMVLSDYGSRCQVCGSTFQDMSGNLHTSVIHVVPPSEDARTNNLGNLMGLCGRHYEYIQFGEWAMLDPETEEPFQSPEEIRDYFLSASPEIDDNGNSYISVPVRFSNLYPEGSESPIQEHETIKYSIPHWKYLCELFGRSNT